MFAELSSKLLATMIIIIGTCQQTFVICDKLDGFRIVRRHHQYRQLVRSANMNQLRWSPYLATKAEELAAECQKNSNDLNNKSVLKRFGINVGIRNATHRNDVGIISIIDSWGSQRSSYTFPSTCNGMCDQWIQMIWAETHELGCGSQICGNEEILVCLYNGKADLSATAPYREGSPCSFCKEGFGNCQDKFCVAENPDRVAATELTAMIVDLKTHSENSTNSSIGQSDVLENADTSSKTTTSRANIPVPQITTYLLLSALFLF